MKQIGETLVVPTYETTLFFFLFFKCKTDSFMIWPANICDSHWNNCLNGPRYLLHTLRFYEPWKYVFVTKVARTWRGESMWLTEWSPWFFLHNQIKIPSCIIGKNITIMHCSDFVRSCHSRPEPENTFYFMSPGSIVRRKLFI